jgi:hypothetical protein
MADDAYLGRVLVVVGVVGLLLANITTGGPPAWVFLALVGAGLCHSLAWRAAGVRQVSGKERRAHARRLKNSEIREKRLLRRTDRIARRCKETLAEVREHPGMPWAHEIAAVIRELQAGQKRHEDALVRSKWLADKAAADLSGILSNRITDNEG